MLPKASVGTVACVLDTLAMLRRILARLIF